MTPAETLIQPPIDRRYHNARQPKRAPCFPLLTPNAVSRSAMYPTPSDEPRQAEYGGPGGRRVSRPIPSRIERYRAGSQQAYNARRGPASTTILRAKVDGPFIMAGREVEIT